MELFEVWITGRCFDFTTNSASCAVQRQVCKFWLEGRPAPGLVEEELMERVKSFAVQVNAGPLTIARRHNVLVWSLNLGAWHVGGIFPFLEVGPVVMGMEAEPDQRGRQPS